MARGPVVVAAMLLLALSVRLGLAVGAPPGRIGGDPAVYDQLGASIAAGHGWPRLSRHLVADPHGEPTALHPPAWPYLLGATYALTGHGTATDQGPVWLSHADIPQRRHARTVAHARWRAARVVNALLGTLAVALAGLVAAELWGGTVGTVTVAVGALYSPLAVLGVALLSEPLFVVFELAALAAVLRARRWSSGRGRCRWRRTSRASARGWTRS
jgi:hypothetical protein